MSRLPLLILLFLIPLGFACRDDGTSALPVATSTPAPSDIVIPPGASLNVGVSTALDGPQRDLGMDLVAAAQLSAGQFSNTLRGRPIVITPRDDGCSDPELAANVADHFITDRALVGVIGPMCTIGGQAANPRYESAGVVHISASATRTELSRQGERYFFRTVWHDDAQGAVQARYAREELGATTAVVLGDGEPYGNALAEEFTVRFEDAGGRVLAKSRLERGTADFSAAARQVVEAQPDVVVFEGFNPEGALLARALGDAGFGGFFLGPDGLLNARDFIDTAGPRAEGATITGGAQPSAGLVESFAALYQRPPTTTFVLQAYDAVTALLRAVDAVATESDDGSLRIDRIELAEALRNQRFAGLTGSITFDDRGERRGETPGELGIAVYRVFNGQLVFVQ